MYVCRACCNDSFDTDNQRKEHEKLCSLKLSPSRCWSCYYCLKEFACYAHASAICHASRCYLNPEAQKASADIRKASLLEWRDGDESNAKRFKAEGIGTNSDAPYCNCAVNPKLCIVCISRSEKNPGRKYFRCSKPKFEDRCNYFKWV